MPKSSTEYTELFGLRVFIASYETRCVRKYGDYKEDFDIIIPESASTVISVIKARILELEEQ